MLVKSFSKIVFILCVTAMSTGAVLAVAPAFAQDKETKPRSDQEQSSAAAQNRTDKAGRVEVIFTGGHETDPRDRGRPVVLIAGALGVSSDVFRKAFSGVTPASGGRRPEPGQVNRNKDVLLRALSPYGIDNERLDTVSDYYRYNGRSGEIWRNAPAQAYAVIRNGAVTGFVITKPGSGYSSVPTITIAGMPGVNLKATLAFGPDFSKNGSIKSVSIAEDNKPISNGKPARRKSPAGR